MCASSSSRIIVKFVAMPKKDKVELERHLANVKAVYARVHILTGSMIPQLQRFVVFGPIYYFGVAHWDFEPRNVIRMGWRRL